MSVYENAGRECKLSLLPSHVVIMTVQKYGTLQWEKFEEIKEKGYTAALEMLAEWDQEHKLPSYSSTEQSDSTDKARKGRGQRRNSI